MSCDALNLFMHDFSRTLVLLWEVHSSLAIARELCFPKQHYESIVPSKPGINGQTVPLTVMGLIAIGLTHQFETQKVQLISAPFIIKHF